jgi:hypothetical protein
MEPRAGDLKWQKLKKIFSENMTLEAWLMKRK